jgi:hypothetical protein
VKHWVTVTYREPTFAEWAGIPVEDRRWTFEVDARDAPSAIESARAEFDEMSTLSGVGWVREVVRWEVSNEPPRTR